MANTLTHKKSAVQGKVPTTAQLSLGELAVNYYDGKIFFKTSILGTETVVNAGDTSSVTGILKGNGLLNVAAVAGTDYLAPGGIIGTPSAGTLTNCVGLPVSTGISGLGTGVAAFLATPSSTNFAAMLTGETGTGSVVFATSPTITGATLTNPVYSVATGVTTTGSNQAGAVAITADTVVLGTVAAGTGAVLPTPAAGRSVTVINRGANAALVYPAGAGIIDALAASAAISVPVNGVMIFDAVSGTQWYSTQNLTVSGGSGSVTSASVVSANGFAGTVATATTTPAITLTTTITGMLKGSASALVAAVAGTDFVAPAGALGTPSSGTLTSCTGLPISTGVSGLAAGAATFLATSTSANLAALLTDETGTGAAVFGTSPTITTPAITFSTNAAVSAAGTTQATGTALTVDLNIVTTAAASSGVVLPTATVGRRVIVVNKGANAVLIYPATGGTIDALAANAGISVAVGGYIEFNASSTTQWYSSNNLAAAAAQLTGLATGVAAFLATPTSANFATMLTNETGTGSVVMGTSPTITTPAITFSTNAAVSAAGTTQATGTALTVDLNIVTTAAASSGVVLPTATVGRRVIVVNKGANAVLIYPATGGTIDALAANAGISVAVGGYIEFNASSTTQWYSTSNISVSVPIATGVSGLGTGIAAALAIATGTAGAPVLVNGVLGTPSSGALTNCTADGTNAVGFLGIPQNAQTAAYTLVLADAGKHIYHASGAAAATYTIPANASVAYPIGATVVFVNQSANAVTIAITTDTLTLSPAGTTGSRTLATNGIATAIKVTSTSWIISGTGLT